MSEKSNKYVIKVISNQFGHNPELDKTVFKNTVANTDSLYGELGATDDDLKEIAIRIDDDLETDLYDDIVEAETVSDIQKIVAETQISDDKFDALLAAFEPKEESPAQA